MDDHLIIIQYQLKFYSKKDNFTDLVLLADQKKKFSANSEFSLQYKPENTPQSVRSSVYVQSQFGNQLNQYDEKDGSPKCNPINLGLLKSENEIPQVKSETSIKDKNSDTNIISKSNLPQQTEKEKQQENIDNKKDQIKSHSQNEQLEIQNIKNLDQDKQLQHVSENEQQHLQSVENKKYEIHIIPDNPKQTEDENLLDDLLTGNDPFDLDEQNEKLLGVNHCIAQGQNKDIQEQNCESKQQNQVIEEQNQVNEEQKQKNSELPEQAKQENKLENQQIKAQEQQQTETEPVKQNHPNLISEENLEDELEKINQQLQHQRQKKKSIRLLDGLQLNDFHHEDKVNLSHSNQTGRAADKLRQKSYNEIDTIIFNQLPDFNLTSSGFQSISPNHPNLFHNEFKSQNPNMDLSFNQVHSQNSVDLNSKKNLNEQLKDKSISQIIHNQSEDFSQLGIENELLNQQSQSNIYDPEISLSNINDISSQNPSKQNPKAAVNNKKKFEKPQPNTVRSRVAKQPSTSQRQISSSSIKSDKKIEAPRVSPSPSKSSAQPKVNSYLVKRQAQTANSKTSVTNGTKPKVSPTKTDSQNLPSVQKQVSKLSTDSNNKSLVKSQSNISIGNQNDVSNSDQKPINSIKKVLSSTNKPINSTQKANTSYSKMNNSVSRANTSMSKGNTSVSKLNTSAQKADELKSKSVSASITRTPAKTNTLATASKTNSTSTQAATATIQPLVKSASSKSTSYAQKAANKQKNN